MALDRHSPGVTSTCPITPREPERHALTQTKATTTTSKATSQMNNRNILSALIVMAFVAGSQSLQAGLHTWSGAVNNSWSNDGNWSSGGAPQFGEANITLVFPAGATRYAATNGVGNYAIDEIVISGNNYTLGGYGITLTGVSYYNLDCSGTNNVIAL